MSRRLECGVVKELYDFFRFRSLVKMSITRKLRYTKTVQKYYGKSLLPGASHLRCLQQKMSKKAGMVMRTRAKTSSLRKRHWKIQQRSNARRRRGKEKIVKFFRFHLRSRALYFNLMTTIFFF